MALPSKSHQDVLKAIVDQYLRLRSSDGYVVTQIHTDRGGEFCSEALERWCASRTILHTFTPGDQPQSNGRVEVSVQWIKSDIRRMLHAASAPFSRWPLERATSSTATWKDPEAAKLFGSSPDQKAFLENKGTSANTRTSPVSWTIMGSSWTLG